MNFSHKAKNRAWNTLQAAIAIQLRTTPGEYDLFSLVHATATSIQKLERVEYGKVVRYLEARYESENTNEGA